MGVFASMFNRLLSRKEEISILMIGLDAAGKTSILHKLKIGGAFVTTCPTIGLNVEKIEFKNLSFTIMDIGGHEKIRPLWKHYFKGVRGVIFVVDSNDADRISEARYELQVLLSEDELKDAAVLIFANKQDLPRSLSAESLATRLELPPASTRAWHVQPSCACTGEGICAGLDWLSLQLARALPPPPRPDPAACALTAARLARNTRIPIKRN
uniref:Uncharacterized protein n=1 Tax=Cryptomonas curvata TaxID=233186 RepID=A0A7S0MC27_9CRYP|mmetsp:Transcript_30183/g.63230  ORF Transcript_30183/g.63230 Transcript_30183/m.63230 type:complete len:212 (+) Transcript_30183:198-833(+)